MTRDDLRQMLLGRGVDSPDSLIEELSDDAVEGAIRWYDSKRQLGQKIGPGLLVTRLRDGGMDGFGIQTKPPVPWWQTSKGRGEWIDENVPDLEPDWAEVAIVGLVQRKQIPTVENVKRMAQAAEQQQAEHDENCRAAVETQKRMAR